MYIAVSTILSTFSRLVCIGFLVTAGITIPQIWNLTNGEFTTSEDGSTVFIPLEMCTPPSVSIEGNAIIFSGPNVGSCHSLTYMIGSCAAALLFAGTAMLLFFIFETMSTCGCNKHITRSSLFGMSIFLAFSLIQAAASCFALFEECRKREEYFLEMFQDSGRSTITTVKMQGARVWFFVTMVTALSAAGVLTLESLCSLCCSNDDKNKTESSPVPPPPVKPAPAEAPTSEDQSQAVSTSAETQKAANTRSNLPPWAQP